MVYGGCVYVWIFWFIHVECCISMGKCKKDAVVVVILFPTEYKQWRTEYMSNITTTINIDDPVGGHQRSQRRIGLATPQKSIFEWVMGNRTSQGKSEVRQYSSQWCVIFNLVHSRGSHDNYYTPVSFGINYRSEWELWKVACGSSFYIIIGWWFVNIDSINVHLW